MANRFMAGMTNVKSLGTFGRKARRFVQNMRSVDGMATPPRQGRINRTTTDPVHSVSTVPASTAARDAQAGVYDTVKPGEHLTV